MALQRKLSEGPKGEWHIALIPYSTQKIDWKDALSVGFQVRFKSLTQGPKILEFEKAIANYVGVEYAVAVSSATAGLHLSVMALDLEKNSKIVTSPISFVASANSIMYSGLRPVFVDINSSDLNLDLEKVDKAITSDSKIKAVIPVHFAGLPSSEQHLASLKSRYDVRIIEDAAHSLGATYSTGLKVGSCAYSDMTVLSFHPVKSMTTGEGGVITTNDIDFYKKLLRLRSHGIQKLEMNFQNQALGYTAGEKNMWFYEMLDLGFNYRMTEIQAALGLSQLKKLSEFIEKRRLIHDVYRRELADLSNCRPAQSADTSRSSHHLFPIRIDYANLGQSRNTLMQNLKNRGIGTQVHYVPIPLQPFYQRIGYSMGSLTNSYKYYFEALSIPIFSHLKRKKQGRVIEALKDLIG